MAADEERDHRARLRKEYKRRLWVLELRQARQGDGVDPAVLTEIEELRASLTGLDLADTPSPAAAVTETLRNRFSDEFEFWVAQLTSLTQRQTRTEGDVAAIKQEASDWRDAHAVAHRTDVDERRHGQRMRVAIELGAIAVLFAAQWPHVSSSSLIIIIAILAMIGIAVLWWLVDRWGNRP